MRYFLIAILFVIPLAGEAHQPAFPEPTGSSDYIVIEDPTLSQAFYGTLEEFPHTYQLIVGEESLDFFVEVLVPDIEVAENNKSVIVVKEEIRGVSEVTRLKAKNAEWEHFYEPFSADSYRRGGSYETQLEAGVYLVEVSTPTNEGRYVLSVGKEERFSLLGYFGTVADIYRVKQFFGKSGLRVVESPLVYVPLLIIIGVGGFIWYRKRNKNYA